MTSPRNRNRKVFERYVTAQKHPGVDAVALACDEFFAPGASIHIIHPFNDLIGSEAYLTRFLEPLMTAFQGLYRRDYLAIAGTYGGSEWVSATGYYVGRFTENWLGIQPTHGLAYLRFGEFHRMKYDQAVESFVFLDIPELMIAAGQWPIQDSPGQARGYTGYLPGPASNDGLLFEDQDEAESALSFQIVTEMLSKLATPDAAWRPYWHDNMVWYGPAAFGSFLGKDDFSGFQIPFENAFDDWKGGSAGSGRTEHFTRYGDGHYTCSGGWPSLSGVQIKPFLDQPATNKMLYMRVCDWWRREADLLVENWVFVDVPHVLLQMGHDVLPDRGLEQ